ncbi:MAG: hypothetical protein K9N34_06820 [Candidatus Marinimicrobia bacterium]|nr:hypothetical protein [Candidatus Neomarinimicrobiota bacterium]MCF7839909.1 hypothetical protein [Candidatus Neomarinimicrobiota bacterium]MCF7903185.1 hypothetical protein [Candidatus Neomarinimicrobiota bacterium]
MSPLFKLTGKTQHGYTIVELFLTVFQFVAMVSWYLILRNRLGWAFIWEAVLAIGLGFFTTWLVTLGMTRVNPRQYNPVTKTPNKQD